MRLWRASIALLLVSLGYGAAAQTYPSQNITIVVGSQPGGTTDLLARVIAQRLTEAWGQAAVVENKVGANNQIAADFVARARPDGHTLWVTPDSFVTNPILNTKLSYEGFVPVTGLVRASHTLIAHPSVPASNLRELLDFAKANPAGLNYGTSGFASAGHLSMEYLQSLAGIKLTGVHYKGATPALNDVIGGHIQLMFHDLGNVAESAKAGRTKIIGIGAPARLPGFSEVPVLAETLPGFEAGAWWGLFAPAGTPPDAVSKINEQVRKIFAEPGVQAQLITPHHYQVFTGPPQALVDFVSRERRKWEKVIREADIKVN